jgi:hypothetical protein
METKTWNFRRVLALMLVGVFAAGTTGCGFFLYSHRMLKANKAIAQAEVNNAEEYAPYEYTYAVEHAKKAKEEVGHADYQAAWEYAKEAETYGMKAKEIARKQKMEAGRETDDE